ncbi:MAG TPA: hypothetical protein VLE20_09725, partial [Blastocatellia bacterium]|nr:hypothetical protein [Blastocatellia bacterium]
MKRTVGFTFRVTIILLLGLVVLAAASAPGDVVTDRRAITQTRIRIRPSPLPSPSGRQNSAMFDKPEPSSTVQSLSGVAALNDWGNRITSLGAAVGENALRTQVRTTIAQLAMFDAVNAVLDGHFKPFSSKPHAAAGASPAAAAISAAYIVALNEFPSQAGNVSAAYANSIGNLSASPEAIATGVVVGEAATNAVLAKREGDNRNLPDLTGYTPESGPGVWIPTPPAFAAPQTPFLQFVTPFGYNNPARFRPLEPPTLHSHRYTADYIEIKD